MLRRSWPSDLWQVQKVIFMLEELGLPYVREDYGRQFGNTQTDAYRKLNPNAKVPTLLDSELAIWEIPHHSALSRRNPRSAADRRQPGGSHARGALDGLVTGRGQRPVSGRVSRGEQGRR